MVCEHLSALDRELAESGANETFRGQAWSDNCREWVYYDVVLDVENLRSRLGLGSMVTVHENLDERSGTERGLACNLCKDGIMGRISGAEGFS